MQIASIINACDALGECSPVQKTQYSDTFWLLNNLCEQHFDFCDWGAFENVKEYSWFKQSTISQIYVI